MKYSSLDGSHSLTINTDDGSWIFEGGGHVISSGDYSYPSPDSVLELFVSDAYDDCAEALAGIES